MKNLNEYETTLQEASWDDNNEKDMTISKLSVINFDDLKKDYVENLKLSQIKSNDALFVNNGDYTFIEFKNGKIDNTEKVFKIYSKIYDSIIIYLDLDVFQGTIENMRNKMTYILVYNKAYRHTEKFEGSEHDFLRKMLISSKAERIRFGLRKFKGYCFKNVHTYSKEEFEEKFVKRIENGM